jgi:sugar lactone lactonase YvrE
VTTFAGSGSTTFADGAGSAAGIYYPYGIAMDTQSNYLYISENSNRIRKIAPTGAVTTFAGSGSAGIVDGFGSSASFSVPRGIAVDNQGLVYVADFGIHRLRVISPAGYVMTLAGTGSASYVDGAGTSATFYSPTGVGVDNRGNVYETDPTYGVIRKISQTGNSGWATNFRYFSFIRPPSIVAHAHVKQNNWRPDLTRLSSEIFRFGCYL